MTEGNSGTATVSFTVDRGGDTSRELILEVQTADGRAVAPSDYVALAPTRLSVPAGVSQASILVTVNGDPDVEENEDFVVRLTSATLVAPAPELRPPSYFDLGDGLNVLGYGPNAVAVGDVNGDGRQDIAVANLIADDVAVLLNTTSPGATSPAFSTAVGFAAGDGPNSVAFGDMNADGKPDLLVSHGNGKTIAILSNGTAAGGATASFVTTAVIPADPPPYFLVAGDINGDGRLDVVAARSAWLSVWLNTTPAGSVTPSFTGPTDFAHEAGFYHLAVGDLNGDGRADLAATGVLNQVTVLLNATNPGAATPSFAAGRSFPVGVNPTHVAIADLNADGRPDLAVANPESDEVSSLLNATAPGSAIANFAAASQLAVPGGPYAIAAGDLNGDGKPDLAVGTMTTGVVWLLRNASFLGGAIPVFAQPEGVHVGVWIQSVALGDLNGDGSLDLVGANDGDKVDGADNVAVMFNATSAPAAPLDLSAPSGFATDTGPAAAAACDLNADGKPDLLVANAVDDSISALISNTPAGMEGSFLAATSHAVGAAPSAIGTGDFNGDGKPDFVAANLGSDNVSVRLNTTSPGGASAQFADAATFAVGDGPGSLAVGDLNGDAKPDVIVGNRLSNSATVLFNTAAPGSGAPAFGSAGTFALGTHPVAVLIADVNGDGKLDVAAANAADDDVSILVNAAAPGAVAASFGAATRFGAGDSPSALAHGDVNGDGKVDLAVANGAGASISVLLNETTAGASTAAFRVAGTLDIGEDPVSVALRDLTGDGRPDLTALTVGGALHVLKNVTPPGSATPSFSAATSKTVGGNPSALAVYDLNGDGHLDLIAADPASDRVLILINELFAANLSTEEARAIIVDDDADRSPVPFTFVDQSGVTAAALIVSNPITVSGINAAVAISVSGGEYSVDGGPFATLPGTVLNGQSVKVRHQAAPAADTVRNTLLTVGDVSDTFSSRTAAGGVGATPGSSGGALPLFTAMVLWLISLARASSQSCTAGRYDTRD